VKATTCSLSGKLAADACYLDPDFEPVTDWYFADSVPTESCVSHQIVTLCADSGLLATPWCPNTITAQGRHIARSFDL
jgi:penicillin-binding protein 1A